MTDGTAQEPGRPRFFRWGFGSALLLVVALLVVGQVVGNLLRDWPPARAFMLALRGDGSGAADLLGSLFRVMVLRDWVLLAFFISAGIFIWLQRAAVLRCLRSMHVGVSFLILATLSIFGGVIVPQIQNFEDPEERITTANYESNFRDFAWAESYFIYHLLHPYGIGMPKVVIPPTALEGLERFGRVYGEEERSNREKMMRASFSGGEKTDAIEAWARDHDRALRRAFDVATFLELNRVYKSDWFATLMMLIFAGVAANTFRKGMAKKWFSVNKMGFFVTHLGIMTLLTGGLVSHLLTDRGIVELWLDEPPKDTYHRHYRNDKFARMPFALGLEYFARKEWKALEIYSLEEEFKTRPPRYTLWPGREIPVDYAVDPATGEQTPRMLLRVRALHDHAVVDTPKVFESPLTPGEHAVPVVALDLPNTVTSAHAGLPQGERRVGLFSPAMPNQGYFDPAGKFRLVVAPASQVQTLFPGAEDGVIGTLDVEVRTDLKERPVSVRVRVGERVKVPGGYELHFVDATSDLDVRDPNKEAVLQGSNNPLPLEQQDYGVTALWVDIHPPNGGKVERRMVMQLVDPIDNGLQEDYMHKDVIARMRWDRWSSPGPARFALLYDEQGGAQLVGEDDTRAPLSVGQNLPLPGDTRIGLQGLYKNARFEKNISFREAPPKVDGFDPTFYERDARGLELEVVYDPGTEREETEVVRMSTTELGQSHLWYTPDERFALVFIENTEGFPFDWRSVLSVWGRDEDGRRYKIDAGSPREREIRVNDYFKYRGYRFFQTNAEASDPNYSGIGVVYDPGIPIVLAGMYTIILGTLLAFIVRPIVQSRNKRRAV